MLLRNLCVSCASAFSKRRKPANRRGAVTSLKELKSGHDLKPISFPFSKLTSAYKWTGSDCYLKTQHAVQNSLFLGLRFGLHGSATNSSVAGRSA